MFKRLFKKIFYCVTCSIIVSVIFCFIFLKGSNKTGAVTEIQYNNTRLEKNSGNKDNIKDIYLEKEIKDIKNKYSDKKCLKIYNKNNSSELEKIEEMLKKINIEQNPVTC